MYIQRSKLEYELPMFEKHRRKSASGCNDGDDLKFKKNNQSLISKNAI